MTADLPTVDYRVRSNNGLVPSLFLQAESAECALTLANRNGSLYARAEALEPADVPPYALTWRDYSESECQIAFPSDYAECDTCHTLTHDDNLTGGEWRECPACNDATYRDGMASAQAYARERRLDWYAALVDDAEHYSSLKACHRALIDLEGIPHV
jgi:hypothetical protein